MLQGIVPALVTPFRQDERIDFDAWQIIIDALIAAGVDGLFVAGGHGEFFSLTSEERTVALRFCAQAAHGRRGRIVVRLAAESIACMIRSPRSWF